VSWRLLALSFTLVPALFAWWSGRQIVRLIGDPALAERLLLRQRQQQLVLFAGFVAPMLAGARVLAWQGFWVLLFISPLLLGETAGLPRGGAEGVARSRWRRV